ncbi:MAG: hypothetical protein ACXABJ_11195 [Candidatus Heimdallarchaeaceae archaeon]|jgi:hypothetical protein
MEKYDNGTFIDPTTPAITEIESQDKSITFAFNGSDTGGSEIAKFVIETDEGNLYEFLNAATVTIAFLEYGVHDIYFRVYDNSGNMYEVQFQINITKPPEPTMRPIPYPFGFISILGLVALAVIYLRKKR